MSIKWQTLWSMTPLLVISAVNIVSVPLFYRYLGPEMYALWFYVNTLSGSFGFMDLGLGTAVIRYVGISIGAGDKKGLREYWGTGNLMAIPILLLMTGVFIGLGVLFGSKWFHVVPENVRLLQWAFVAGGFAMFLSYYSQFWLMLSQAHFDFRFVGLSRSIVNVAQMLTAIWLAHLTGNPVILIWAGILFSLFQLGLFVWHARKNYQLGLNLRDASLARAKEMFGISSKVFATVLVSSFGGSVDRLLLGKIAAAGGRVNRVHPLQHLLQFRLENHGVEYCRHGPGVPSNKPGLGPGEPATRRPRSSTRCLISHSVFTRWRPSGRFAGTRFFCGCGWGTISRCRSRRHLRRWSWLFV